MSLARRARGASGISCRGMRSFVRFGRLGRALICLAALLGAATLAPRGPATAAAAPVVSSVRFGHEQQRTRVVIEVDHRVDFRVQAIDSPPRLVIDLPEVKWRVGPDPLGDPRGMALRHRYGKFAQGRSRLVVDMAEPFRIADSFVLPPADGARSFRVVVDLLPTAQMPSPGAPGGAEIATISPPDDPAPPVRGGEVPAPVAKPLDQAMEVPPARPVRPLIVLDPGHGGIDPGTMGTNGLPEKAITLAMGLELRDTLLETGRYRVVMTRETDEYVALRDRIGIARKAGGNLFISLHADSIDNPETRGASVYTLSAEASDAEAARLAAAENRVDILAGADLSYQDPLVAEILLDLSQGSTNNRSILFAEKLVGELGEVTTLLRNTRRYAGFVVLKSPDTPSVLVELGYLSHRRDAQLLNNPAHRAKLSRAILHAVDRHFGFIK
jgi:N-acetylmuramoyl-L-alanine amidase